MLDCRPGAIVSFAGIPRVGFVGLPLAREGRASKISPAATPNSNAPLLAAIRSTAFHSYGFLCSAWFLRASWNKPSEFQVFLLPGPLNAKGAEAPQANSLACYLRRRRTDGKAYRGNAMHICRAGHANRAVDKRKIKVTAYKLKGELIGRPV